MFLFFSKITGLFITPSIWLVFIFLWWMLTKSAKAKKKLSIAFVVIVMVFGNEFLFSELCLTWQPKPVVLTGKYDAGILLGGFVSFDKNGIGYLNSASDRFIAASTLYKMGYIKRIIVSAGNIKKGQPNEASYIAKRMAELGIDKEDIIIESRSRTTFENAVYTKQKIDSLGLKPPFVLITSALHLPRAISVFKKAGISVTPYPCNYEVIEKKYSWDDYLIPKLDVINNWRSLMKEMVGLAGYKAFGKA